MQRDKAHTLNMIYKGSQRRTKLSKLYTKPTSPVPQNIILFLLLRHFASLRILILLIANMPRAYCI